MILRRAPRAVQMECPGQVASWTLVAGPTHRCLRLLEQGPERQRASAAGSGGVSAVMGASDLVACTMSADSHCCIGVCAHLSAGIKKAGSPVPPHSPNRSTDACRLGESFIPRREGGCRWRCYGMACWSAFAHWHDAGCLSQNKGGCDLAHALLLRREARLACRREELGGACVQSQRGLSDDGGSAPRLQLCGDWTGRCRAGSPLARTVRFGPRKTCNLSAVGWGLSVESASVGLGQCGV